ncbi:MAG: replicative DNA helicase [Solirubrobacteraceae bacterium]
MSAVQTIAVPPHNLEAEKSVLGAVLLDERHLHGLLVEQHLRPDHFYREQHGAVFAAMMELYESDRKIDHLTVSETLRQRGKLEEIGGPAAIDELAGWVPAAGHAREYGQIVRDNAQLRALLTTSYEIQASVMSREAPPRDLVERAERSVLEVAHDDRQKKFRPIAEILDQETDKLHRLSTAKTPLTGTPSGFKDLDELTGGFQPGNLIIVAARPSMGKSALVANVAENAVLGVGHPSQRPSSVALFSLEMSESELAQRFVASQARIRGEELRKGRVAENRWPKILDACQRLSGAPLWIDDSSDTGVLEVRAKARRLHHQLEDGLGLIIIDYLQLMRHEGRVESRVEQVGQISRGLKSLARELNVPVIALSQLSRAVEQRGGEKRPILSDLRECVTGETLVRLADGSQTPIRELVGKTPEVLALDERHRVVRARSDLVWSVGRRTVKRLRLASGRELRATPDHRVLSGSGWRRLSELKVGDRLAVARRLPEPEAAERWPDDRLVLLGQLIGDGSYLKHAPMRYTTASEENSAAVAHAARSEFGATVTRYSGRGSWHQLLISGNGNRWHPAGVGAWLKELGIFGQRSAEKRIPDAVFRLGNDQIGLLLRHLWATDGCIWSGITAGGARSRRVYFATASRELAGDVSALLMRLGIVARMSSVKSGDGRLWSVVVSGAEAERRFLDVVGAFGPRVQQAEALRTRLPQAATNVDTLPTEIWDVVRAQMAERGFSHRAMARARGTAYGGSAHFAFAPSRATVASYAHALDSPTLALAAESDVFWDRIVTIKDDGEEDVFDLTVPGPASWLADGIVSHNSGQIEQDADLVMFIYREEYYDKDSERPGEADIIIAKHRNGPVGDVVLTFQKEYPKFMNYAGERFAA